MDEALTGGITSTLCGGRAGGSSLARDQADRRNLTCGGCQQRRFSVVKSMFGINTKILARYR